MVTKYIIEREYTTNRWNILEQRMGRDYAKFINTAASVDQAIQYVEKIRSHDFYKRHPHEISIICDMR